jgi:hypothetical protein
LVERERSLFNLDRTICLDDLTSTYFKGQAAANPKPAQPEPNRIR